MKNSVCCSVQCSEPLQKFLEYFSVFMNPRKSVSNSQSSQTDGEVLEVPQFLPFVPKYAKQLYFSFTHMLPSFGMICLIF